MLEIIPITQVRKNFLPLIRRVGESLFKFVIAKQGKPIAVVLSYEEYTRMVETLKATGDGGMAEDIMGSLKDLRRGDALQLKDVLGDE